MDFVMVVFKCLIFCGRSISFSFFFILFRFHESVLSDVCWYKYNDLIVNHCQG